jgi:hypothetical protein
MLQKLYFKNYFKKAKGVYPRKKDRKDFLGIYAFGQYKYIYDKN